MRIGIYVLQDAPFDILVERFRRVEAEGFDFAYVADHAMDFRGRTGPWFDGWVVLAAAAAATQRIRLGTLVANPILRPPQVAAREAHALHHLSGGRFELGIGTGIAGFDFAAAGIAPWSARERAARFAEYVEVVRGILSAGEPGFSHAGPHVTTRHPPLRPPAAPQITVGGQSPTVRRVAARSADCWNTHGPFGATVPEILEVTREQNRRLDAACREQGRDPSTLRRSLLLFGALAAEPPREVIARFGEAGMGEFVLMWPEDGRLELPV